MKKITTCFLLSCFILSMYSCAKKDQAASAGFQEKVQNNQLNEAYKLSEFLAYNWKFAISYNANGLIDSIRNYTSQVSFMYKVKYNGNRLDSVAKGTSVQDQGVFVNFVYDIKGRLVQYTWVDLVFFEPPVTTKIMYDTKDHFTAIIKSEPGDPYYMLDSITTDQYGAMISRYYNYENWFIGTADYTTDINPNPLTMIKDLQFIIGDQGHLQEYFLSRRNLTSKVEGDGYRVNYENTYDETGRLVKSKFFERYMNRYDSLTFTYAR